MAKQSFLMSKKIFVENGLKGPFLKLEAFLKSFSIPNVNNVPTVWQSKTPLPTKK